MKHLKTYNESRVYLSEERQLDITKIYADCFMELSDLNAYIYVDNYNDDIKKVVDGTAIVFAAISNNLWRFRSSHHIRLNKTDELIIKIKGYSKYEPIYNNNESKLREIYEYLKQNLKNDEYRFSKIANVNIENLIKFHIQEKTIATVTAVQPAGRFGSIEICNNKVKSFKEKPIGDNRWISGGFFVCEPKIFDFIPNDETIFEREPLENIANMNQLSVWKHEGFWAAMDTLRDKTLLENLWETQKAPWKIW